MPERVHLISYGDERFAESKRRLEAEARAFGVFDSVSMLGPDDLDEQFRIAGPPASKAAKGGGYWLWKPRVVVSALEVADAGDVVVYVDAGCTIDPSARRRFAETRALVRDCKAGLFAYQMHHQELMWTKRELFDHFGLSFDSREAVSGQISASVIWVRKCERSQAAVRRWAQVASDDPDLFTDDLDPTIQHESFITHRHDQSVFSLILKTMGSCGLPDETQGPWLSPDTPIRVSRRRLPGNHPQGG